MMPEERLKELGSIRLQRLIEDRPTEKTPVRNKLFSNFLLHSLILIHYSYIKSKIVPPLHSRSEK